MRERIFLIKVDLYQKTYGVNKRKKNRKMSKMSEKKINDALFEKNY